MLKQLEAEAVGQVNIQEQYVGRGAGLQQGHGLRYRLGRAEYLKRLSLPLQQVG
nr:hypothetical protein [Hymenobacter sp. BRD67]